MMNILITGFASSPGRPANLSWKLAHGLEGETMAGVMIKATELPLHLEEAMDVLHHTFQMIEPVAVVGLDTVESSEILLQESAVNQRDLSCINFSGIHKEIRGITSHVPSTLRVTLPLERLLDTLKKNGFSARISNQVGTHLTHALLYHLLYQIKTSNKPLPLGFIYLPYNTDNRRENTPLSFEKLVSALQILLEELVLSLTLLETTRLHLRPLLLHQLKAHMENPEELAQQLGINPLKPLSPIMKRVYSIKIQHIQRDPSHLLYYTYWLILHKKDRRYLGSIGPKGLPDEEGNLEIGYGLEEEAQGYGYMVEALEAFSDFALNYLSIKRVKAITQIENSSSQQVLKRAGFCLSYQDQEQGIWYLAQKNHQERKF